MAQTTIHPRPLEPLTPLDPLPDPRLEMTGTALALAAGNGFPVVATARRGKDNGMMVGAAIALGLGALAFVSLNRAADPVRVAAPVAPAGQPQAAAAPQVRPAVPPPVTAVPPPTQAQLAALAHPAAAPDARLQLGNAPAVVYDTTIADPVATVRASGALAVATPGAPQQQSLTENEAFGIRVGNAAVDTASASRLADPTNTVTQGTMIPAVLETAIDSDLPGFVRAVVSQDVRSFDGKRVLIPRSSRLIGQYKSGLAAGQTRAYVLWTRLLRPDGVTIALGSPAVEFDGRSGLSGEVNQHFFRRFGAASLLSVLGGLGALASGGAGVVIAAGGSSAAASAAQRDGQIPPTVRVPQGQPIRVYTARDLDFSTVAP